MSAPSSFLLGATGSLGRRESPTHHRLGPNPTAAIAHVVIGLAVLSGNADALASAESSAIQLEAIRRMGVVLYLVSIALGLVAIAEVLRFQAIRLRELPAEAVR